jgi:hypothetical protein
VAELSPLLNIGSGTKAYRTKFHPWIDAEITDPLEARGCKIVHTDIQSGEGVDIVGDLANSSFLDELRALRFRAVICGNLFEHVVNRDEIAHLLASVVPKGGYLVVSGPYRFPYHPDPIDTGFRPTISDLATLFPDTVLVHGATVEGQRIIAIQAREHNMSIPVALLRNIARLAVPFRNSSGWQATVRNLPWLPRHAAATIVLLRKCG